MHPVLADRVFPFADSIAGATLLEAQVSPNLDSRRWSGQKVVEHAILSFNQSREELERRTRSGESPARSASWIQWIIKTQVCFFHYLPSGVPTSFSLRPDIEEPQAGAVLAARFLDAAEQLGRALTQARVSFGMRPCGYHPMYGPLRVEEWRVYHAVHLQHHQKQFDAAIAYARAHPEEMEQIRGGVSGSDQRARPIPGATSIARAAQNPDQRK